MKGWLLLCLQPWHANVLCLQLSPVYFDFRAGALHSDSLTRRALQVKPSTAQPKAHLNCARPHKQFSYV